MRDKLIKVRRGTYAELLAATSSEWEAGELGYVTDARMFIIADRDGTTEEQVFAEFSTEGHHFPLYLRAGEATIYVQGYENDPLFLGGGYTANVALKEELTATAYNSTWTAWTMDKPLTHYLIYAHEDTSYNLGHGSYQSSPLDDVPNFTYIRFLDLQHAHGLGETEPQIKINGAKNFGYPSPVVMWPSDTSITELAEVRFSNMVVTDMSKQLPVDRLPYRMLGDEAIYNKGIHLGDVFDGGIYYDDENAFQDWIDSLPDVTGTAPTNPPEIDFGPWESDSGSGSGVPTWLDTTAAVANGWTVS